MTAKVLIFFTFTCRIFRLSKYLDRKSLYILLVILLFGACLRFWGIGDRTIWLDEGIGYFYTNQSWSYLWNTVPEYEVHLPFFYSTLKLWTSVFGTSEAALRTPSALASLGVILCLFVAGRIAGGPRNGIVLGLAAAALFAVWKLQIEFARDARPYAYCALGMSLMMIGTLQIISFPEKYKAWPWKIAFYRSRKLLVLASLFAGMSLMLWSHNVGLIAVFVNAVFLFFWWAFAQRCDVRLFVTLGTCGVLVVLSFLPGIPLLISQAGEVSSHYWQSKPSLLGLLSISTKAVAQPLPLLGFETNLGTILASLVAAIVFLMGAVGYVKVTYDYHRNRFVSIYPIYLCLAIWVLLVTLTYIYKPIIMPRTMVFVVPPALIILSGLPFVVREDLRNVTAALLVGFGGLGALNTIHTSERPYAPITRHISESDSPDAPVLVLPNSAALPIQYYNERLNSGLNLQPLPEAFPARSKDYIYVTGNKASAAVDADMLSATIATVRSEETIWTVIRFVDLFDPNGIVRKYLLETGRCPRYIYGLDRTATLERWHQSFCDQ